MCPQYERLAKLLKDNHYLNSNGCWVTDYSKIPKFKLLSSTTNGDSGTAVFERKRVYFYTLLSGCFVVEDA